MPRGSTFSGSEPKKTFGTSAQQAQKRQGHSTFQRVRTKNQLQKGHNKCKAKANRLPQKNRKMDARKGGGTFFSTRTFDTHHSIYPKRAKPFEDKSAQKKGGDIFSQKTKFPCIASSANKSYIETTNTSAKNTFGQRLIRKGGDVFFKNHHNERRPG